MTFSEDLESNTLFYFLYEKLEPAQWLAAGIHPENGNSSVCRNGRGLQPLKQMDEESRSNAYSSLSFVNISIATKTVWKEVLILRPLTFHIMQTPPLSNVCACLLWTKLMEIDFSHMYRRRGRVLLNPYWQKWNSPNADFCGSRISIPNLIRFCWIVVGRQKNGTSTSFIHLSTSCKEPTK